LDLIEIPRLNRVAKNDVHGWVISADQIRV
jgi:hypothetical protein